MIVDRDGNIEYCDHGRVIVGLDDRNQPNNTNVWWSLKDTEESFIRYFPHDKSGALQFGNEIAKKLGERTTIVVWNLSSGVPFNKLNPGDRIEEIECHGKEFIVRKGKIIPYTLEMQFADSANRVNKKCVIKTRKTKIKPKQKRKVKRK